MRARIRRIAARYRQAQRRSPKRLGGETEKPVARRPRDDQIGIPRLCSRLAAIAEGTGSEKTVSERVVAASDVVAPLSKEISDRQYRAFVLAYVCRRPAAEAAAILGCSTRAVTCRLQRVSRKLQEILIRHMAVLVPSDEWRELSAALAGAQGGKKSRRVVTRSDNRACAILIEALEALIHRDPRKRMS